MRDSYYICVVQPNAAMLELTPKMCSEFDIGRREDKMGRNWCCLKNFLYLAMVKHLPIEMEKCQFDFVRFPTNDATSSVGELIRDRNYNGVIFSNTMLNSQYERKKTIILGDALKKDKNGLTALDRYKLQWRQMLAAQSLDWIFIGHPEEGSAIEGATYLTRWWIDHIPGFDSNPLTNDCLYVRNRPLAKPHQI